MITYQRNLNEGLRRGDLTGYVNPVMEIDRYKSKMGEDQDIAVLSFKVKEKLPATDLMEFIEKGYNFVLDADISVGEEHDGQYEVFVEIQRTPELPKQINELLKDIGNLCIEKNWKFKYRNSNTFDFNIETASKEIPTTPDAYEYKVTKIKEADIKEFFDQGAVDIRLDENNQITFSRPYSGNIDAKFVSIGPYKIVKDTLPGKLSLDESSQSQVLFLNKYLGNYDINKIGNKFLIRNGKNAVVIEKDRW